MVGAGHASGESVAAGDTQRPEGDVAGQGRRRTLLIETWLVLGVSLGASAVWGVLAIIRRMTAEVALNRQTSGLNQAVTPDRPWLDLAYQLAAIGLGIVPALLAVHLLRRDAAASGGRPRMTVTWPRRLGRDLAQGFGLAAVVGIPGLGFYLLAREMGINTQVQPAGLGPVWWAVPVLLLAALQNAVLEEIVMVGYLLTRWRQAGVGTWVAVAGSALVRGSYHLYQGFGGFLGNLAMGLLFGWVFTRTRRVGPLVAAHALLDVVAFVGYLALKDRVGWL